jgi:hypothetical protein
MERMRRGEDLAEVRYFLPRAATEGGEDFFFTVVTAPSGFDVAYSNTNASFLQA